ncbi:hypothetical protein ABZS77_23795 [Micromonospora sp. NPDC005298]|uniref:hypothetical protein n=1 Tax=Micromonospora sp. NPDC005298 TaxID=3156873 RepID=UPI0033BA3B83
MSLRGIPVCPRNDSDPARDARPKRRRTAPTSTPAHDAHAGPDEGFACGGGDRLRSVHATVGTRPATVAAPTRRQWRHLLADADGTRPATVAAPRWSGGVPDLSGSLAVR